MVHALSRELEVEEDLGRQADGLMKMMIIHTVLMSTCQETRGSQITPEKRKLVFITSHEML